MTMIKATDQLRKARLKQTCWSLGGSGGMPPQKKNSKNCLFKLGSSRKIDQQKCTIIDNYH